MVTFPARSTNIYKIWKFRTVILCVFYNISPPNFAIFTMLFLTVVKDLPRSKLILVYCANCPLFQLHYAIISGHIHLNSMHVTTIYGACMGKYYY